MKTRTIRRTIAVTAIALCATTTVVACGSDASTGDGGVGALFGTTTQSTPEGGTGAATSGMPDDSTFLRAGEKMDFTTGTIYTSDGKEEFGKDATGFTVSLDNLRQIDRVIEGDQNAPDGHPDGDKKSFVLCYDASMKFEPWEGGEMNGAGMPSHDSIAEKAAGVADRMSVQSVDQDYRGMLGGTQAWVAAGDDHYAEEAEGSTYYGPMKIDEAGLEATLTKCYAPKSEQEDSEDWMRDMYVQISPTRKSKTNTILADDDEISGWRLSM